MLDVCRLVRPEICEIRPHKFGNERSCFSEVFNRERFAAADIAFDCIQNKLVRLLRGRDFDIAIDIRKRSPTFGQSVSLELSAQALNQILVPVGFAYCFLTLFPYNELFYKVSAPCSGEHDGSICCDDPTIGIDWSLAGRPTALSTKDAEAPSLAEAAQPFVYEGAAP